MVCFYCSGQLFVTSVWYEKNNEYKYSYICFCINKSCFQYKVKFKKYCKYECEINNCKNFEIVNQKYGNAI